MTTTDNKLRALAAQWISSRKALTSYDEGGIDACNNCADQLLAILNEPQAVQVMDDSDNARRYQQFCQQAMEGVFPQALLDDAKNMGDGVLDMHFDALQSLQKAGKDHE